MITTLVWQLFCLMSLHLLVTRGQNPLHLLGQYSRENGAAIFELFLECMPNYPIDQCDINGNTREHWLIKLSDTCCLSCVYTSDLWGPCVGRQLDCLWRQTNWQCVYTTVAQSTIVGSSDGASSSDLDIGGLGTYRRCCGDKQDERSEQVRLLGTEWLHRK